MAHRRVSSKINENEVLPLVDGRSSEQVHNKVQIARFDLKVPLPKSPLAQVAP